MPDFYIAALAVFSLLPYRIELIVLGSVNVSLRLFGVPILIFGVTRHCTILNA
jgi:hypothetical protein